MSQALSTAPIPGTRDFFPEEMSVRQQVFDTLYRVVESFGYLRYDGPMLEPFELYAAKSGEELVNQQIYRLTDRGGRDLALRPEMTPTAARMIAARAGSLPLPARWYSHPNLYRYERKQRGRYREHWQVNVDVFGTESYLAEMEIIELGAEMMFSLGAKTEDFIMRVSDRGVVQAALVDHAGVPLEKLPAVYGVLDKFEKIGEEESIRALVELGVNAESVLRTITSTTEELFRIVPAPALAASNIVKVIREGLVSSRTVNLQFDARVIRGFEYYTSSVFEIFDTDPANRRSIAGGGRYDNLVALFGKTRLPGIGFGMGDVTLIDFLETHNIAPKPRIAPDVQVFTPNPEDPAEQKRIRELAHLLRTAGLRVTAPLEARKLSKLLEKASKEGVRFAVIAGIDEATRGTVKLRDLNASQEREVVIGELSETIRQALGNK